MGWYQGRSFWTAKIREFDQTRAFALFHTGLLGGRIPVISLVGLVIANRRV